MNKIAKNGVTILITEDLTTIDTNNSNSTFEICFYELNTAVCEELFAPGRRTLSVQDYMLKNKADCAYELLDKKSEQIQSPEYITEALQWIRE